MLIVALSNTTYNGEFALYPSRSFRSLGPFMRRIYRVADNDHHHFITVVSHNAFEVFLENLFEGQTCVPIGRMEGCCAEGDHQ